MQPSTRPEPPRPRTLVRRLPAWIAGIAIVVLAVAWWQRDLPRRLVQRELARALDARVVLGQLEIRGLNEFVLRELTVTDPRRQPYLRSLRVAELEVHGTLQEIRSQRYASIYVLGAELVVGPPAGTPAVDDAPPPQVFIGRLDLQDVRVVIETTDDRTAFIAEGSLEKIGGRLSGSLRAAADQLALGPLLALGGQSPVAAGVLTGFSGTVEIEDGGQLWNFVAHSRESRVARGGSELELPGLTLSGSVVSKADAETLQLSLRSEFPGVRSALAEAELDRSSGAWAAGAVRLEGVDVGRVAAVLDLLPEAVEVETDLALELRLERPGRATYAVTGRVDRARFPIRGAMAEGRRAVLQVSGAVEFGDAGWRPTDLSFEGLANLEGFTVDTVEAGRVALQMEGSLEPSRTIAAARWQWEGIDLEALPRSGVEALDALAISGMLRAEGTLEGSLEDPHLTARLVVPRLQVRSVEEAGHSDWRVGGELVVDADWQASRGTLRVSRATLHGELELPSLEPRALSLQAVGQFEPASGAVEIADLGLSLANLTALSGRGSWRRDSRPSGSFQLTVDETPLEPLRNWLSPITGNPLPDFRVTGTIGGELEGHVGRDGHLEAHGSAATAGFSLGHEDGTRTVQGLDSVWSLGLRRERASEPWLYEAQGELGGFLALWRTVFADYSEAAGTLHVSGSLGDRAWDTRASLSLPDAGLLDGSLEGRRGTPSTYSLSLTVPDLGSAFARWIQPLSESIPVLTRMTAGGRLRSTLSGAFADDGARAAGKIEIEDARLEGQKGTLFIHGLDLDLPLELDWNAQGELQRAADSAGSLQGRLAFDEVSLGGVRFAETTTALIVRDDTIGLQEGLTLPLFDGWLRLEQLTLADLSSGAPHLRSGLRLSGIQLRALSDALGIPGLDGQMDGHFPSVSVYQRRLEVDGDGEFAIFGGQLLFHDISGEEILGSFPKLRFSAEARGIDLRQVTQRFDFGEMSGILDGWIRDCELVRWKPLRFEVRLETVKTPGVPQRINVKAINNITILGSGGSTNVLDRGIHKLFDSYPYDRLGVEMALTHDTFTLEGLERRGDRELFLKGRLPLRIDIVNGSPGRRISFDAMLRRLADLDYSVETKIGSSGR